MLSHNLRNLRKQSGLSQEEVATRLHVVRQTVSKWEKGLSVPDAEMLIRIAEELDTSVNILLGGPIETNSNHEGSPEWKAIADKLEVLNEQFARRCQRQRKIGRTVFILLGVAAALFLVYQLADCIYYRFAMDALREEGAAIGGHDGPTQIYVSAVLSQEGRTIGALVMVALSAVGIYLTRRK